MSTWKPLAGVRVVEACQRLVGPLAGWHLALMGAQVIKIEPTSGDAARGWGSGAVFDVLNVGKQFVALDATDSRDRGVFADLCAGADAVLADSSWSEAMAREGSCRAGARTQSVVIIDEGEVPGGSGSSETLAQAALALTPYIGTQEGQPTRFGADVASESAAAAATQAALAGLVRAAEVPLVSRVSIDRAMAALKTIHWAARSDPLKWIGYHVTGKYRQPDLGYRVRDGWVTLDYLPSDGDGWWTLCEEIGLGDFAREVGDAWYNTVGMEEGVDQARQRYEQALAKYSVDEAIAIIRKHKGWSVPFLTPEQMLRHPQSKLYASMVRDDDGQASIRLPWRVGNEPQGTSSLAAAPGIGAHNEEVLETPRGGGAR